MSLELAQPSLPWLVLTAAAAMVTVLLQALALRRWRRGQGPGSLVAAVAIAGLAVAVVSLLVAAACDPVLRRQRPGATGAHLVVVVDVSASVQRAAPSWAGVRAQLVDRVTRLVEQTGRATRHRTTCSVVTCADGRRTVFEQLPLDELPRRLAGLGARSFPPVGASNLAAGLETAATLIGRAGGRGAVLLLSDGWQTTGDALAAAGRLARQGIPVSVLPVAGKSPEIGLYAADLPAVVEAGSRTVARLFLLNRTSATTAVRLQLGLPGSPAPPQSLPLPAGAEWLRVRQPLLLEQPGLQALDLLLWQDDEVVTARRFFTLVTRPPKVLALGDAAWAAGLPPGKLELISRRPDQIRAAGDLTGFDVVVANGVTAESLPAPALTVLASEIERRGTGLLLVNGHHRGGPDDRTTLMSYDTTALEPLLPLATTPEGQGRHVVILLDASGSMAGWRVETSKAIAAHIVDQLEEEDHLDLIVFTGGAHHLINDLEATDLVKEMARDQIGLISASGGTDPSDALRLISDRSFDRCGLFFISDGGFGRLAARPDCQITVFAIDHTSQSIPGVLRELAEPIPVGRSFSPASVKLGFLDDPRKRWQPGTFKPIAGIDALRRGWQLLPEPAPSLAGNAVTFAREGSQVAAVRPRLAQPVLAFRDSEGGTVGEMTGALNQGLTSGEDPAVYRWIKQLLGFSERDRYTIAVADHGPLLGLRLTLLADRGRVPQVNGISARIDLGEQRGAVVSLRPDPELAGVFAGELDRPEVTVPTAGLLFLREHGPAAVTRPQRLPIVVPPPLPAAGRRNDEAWCAGLDQALLRALCEAGGGSYNPGADPGAERDTEAQLLPALDDAGGWRLALRPCLLVLACLLYLVQIAVRRLTR